MKLITEEIESVEIITEEKNGVKTLYIQGPFLQAEVTNRNGRNYPLTILEREVKRYNDSFIQKDRKSTRLNSSHIPLSRMPSSA